MIDKNILMYYARLWNEYINNSNIIFNEEQANIINYINNEAKNNQELNKLLEELKQSNNKEELIENYFNKLENKKSQNEYEVISETFGIEVTNIEHKYLNNGKEIFSFYDNNIGRNRILENNKNGVSLVEELKEIQANNKKYQTSSNENNAEEILKDKNIKENCELKMIPLEEVGEHLSQVKNLTIEDYNKLMFMIKNANSLDIQYINIENLIALNKEGKIYEIYNNSSYEYQIGEPNTAHYNEEVVNVSEKINENYRVSEQNMALQSNYEDNPNVVEYAPEDEEILFDNLDEEIQEKTIMLYENPELIDKIPEEQKELWLEYIELYKKKLEIEEKQKENEYNKPKVKVYTKEKDNNLGFIYLKSIVAIISIVIITIVTIVMIVK